MADGGIYLGAADWLFPHWLGAFYPEDMPEAWRMAYYGTQFSCLWLPRGVWRQLPRETVAGWLSDTPPGFRFILETDGPATPGEAAAQAAFPEHLRTRCRMDDPGLFWFDRGVDLRALAEWLRRRVPEGDAYLLSTDGDLTTLERVATLLGLLNIGQAASVG